MSQRHLALIDRLREIVLQLREHSQVMLSPVKHAHGGYWVHPSQEQHIWKLVDACAPDMLECLDLLDRSSSVSKDVFLKVRDLRRHIERRGDAPDALPWIGATETMVDEFDALLTASQLDTAAAVKARAQIAAGDDGTKPVPKRPADIAFMAWRLRDLKGYRSQAKIAEAMSKQLGRRVHQGEVSRWLKEVNEYFTAGGVFPDLPGVHGRPQSVDPVVIDMGRRRDGRTPHQRKQRDPDAD